VNLKGNETTSATLSYADGILGPVVKANQGETVNVHLQTNLSKYEFNQILLLKFLTINCPG
jgi:FtsP/CotA-like multicopper oxidase with cupredoxin domain